MAAPRRSFESHPLNLVFRAVLFVFVAAVLLFEIPGALEHRRTPDPGIDTQNLVIQRLRPGGPNQDRDIQPGDVIYAVDGERVRNHIHFESILSANHSFAPQEYTLARDNRRVDVTIAYVPRHFAFRDAAFPAVALFFLIVGFWVYLRRPDALGSLFAANCAMLASFLTHRPSVAIPALQLGGELLHDAIILFFPAVLLHFFLLFPDRNGRERGRSPRRRIVYVYAPPAVLYLTGAVLAVRRFYFLPVGDGVVPVLLGVAAAYFAAYPLASLVTFVRHYRSSATAQKAKLRVAIAGAITGFVPFLFVTVFRSISPGESERIEVAAAVCLAFVPATFAYSILKHGAIELNAVVRKSLVYAFLSAAVIAIYYAVVHLLGDAMAGAFGVSSAVVMPIAALVLALVFAPARSQIQRVVDRFFYRAEYVYKQEVYEFNRQLARRLSKGDIYGYFVERAEALLSASYVAVYTNDGNRTLVRGRVSGTPPALPKTFALDSFLGRYFSRYKTPLMAEFLDRSWERPNLDAESRRFLAIPRLSVCVPIVAPDQFVALVLLGEKLSGVTYRRADAELLETFADQLALVLQNVDLVHASLQQERLKSEVMLAREIQLSLLPVEPPRPRRVHMRGQMVSSFEVGGDYFDYFEVDDDHIGVAIGDVSGKGIPAAMLMSSLQAVFKNLATKARLSPAEINRELNQHLFDHAKEGQFATFFYGVFELSTSRFTFSNAGHCPALLIRNGYADRLAEGGLVLGVQRDQGYREGVVRIERDNLTVLYTDGVTEQKNAAGDEYGEERLVAFLGANRNLPLDDLQVALLEDVVGFGGGNQDDDITIVIARHHAA
jgi:sigma-B regulation protein RsbU (phosphoserine phosphatase)